MGSSSKTCTICLFSSSPFPLIWSRPLPALGSSVLHSALSSQRDTANTDSAERSSPGSHSAAFYFPWNETRKACPGLSDPLTSLVICLFYTLSILIIFLFCNHMKLVLFRAFVCGVLSLFCSSPLGSVDWLLLILRFLFQMSQEEALSGYHVSFSLFCTPVSYRYTLCLLPS